MGIPVEDQSEQSNASEPKKDERGKCLIRALVGPEPIVAEVYVPAEHTSAFATYYLNGVCVDAMTYRDVIDTADKDRWCPNCRGMHVYGHDEDDGFDPEPSKSENDPEPS